MRTGAIELIDEEGEAAVFYPNPGRQPDDTYGRDVRVIWERDRHLLQAAERVDVRRLRAASPTRWSIEGEAFDIAYYSPVTS